MGVKLPYFLPYFIYGRILVLKKTERIYEVFNIKFVVNS